MTRTLPARVDVAIVGSGPCGAAYARVLSEQCPDATIAVFEVGPLLADPPGTHVKNIVDPDERARAQRRSEGPAPLPAGTPTDTNEGYATEAPRLVRPGTFLLASGYRQPGQDGLPGAAMSSNVGGMGAHWTGACPRPGGRERIGFLPELDDLLAEGERLLSVDAHAFDDAPFAGEVRKRLSGALDDERAEDRRVAPMPLAVVRHDDGRVTWSGSDVVFGEPTRANPRFTLVPEALVTEVVVADGRARGVRVRDLQDGGEHVVAARFVVVAADALRTPQLLWASGVRPRALGRWLNDQPQTVYAVRLRDVDTGPEADVDPREQPRIVAQSGVSWVPYTDEDPFHGQVMQLDASPVPLADADEPEPGTIVGLGWFCAKDLQESDRVEFSDTETDPYGMPAMRIHYRLTEADSASIAAARDAVRRAAAALGEPLDDRDPLTFPPGASLHYQGTVRMGETDDGTSVCSPTSRVWDVAGLYVAGNGVIPTPIACNPTLTAVALAVGGARDIAAALTPEEN
ncbi:GMC family oxidoreductase [Geodermatophilus aquaeductus]|uniref:Pyranose oxidase n=1 Tax=Geodermatophilus aquaeductus TaxID=1564161 RepID=A0A521E7Z6_9ACTN|nr:GMC oxidoreductase [Geodermatophilus aquaeductus]SMO80053.1 pyranose oxidase [Geodermatophilus aquaeductus]